MPLEEAVDIFLQNNFLRLAETTQLLSVSKIFRAKLTHAVVTGALSNQPLTGKQRYEWWMLSLLRASSESPKLQNLYTGDLLYHYLSLIQQLGVARASCNTPGQVGEVMRDVKRTFPSHTFFMDGMPGQDMLARVLQACIVSQPDVGYCQGMNFVVGAFIIHHPICSECTEKVMNTHVPEITEHIPGSTKSSPAKFWAPANHFNMYNLAEAESEIYVALMCLLDTDGMFNMQCAWRTGMPVMRLYNYQLDRLLKWNFPQLHNHFIDIGFSPEILLSQWFLTFYIYTFPFDMCMDMWDFIMHGGWPAIFSFALAFCGIMEPMILDMNIEDLSMEMRKWKCDKFELPEGITFSDLIKLAISINVSEAELLTLQEAFANKLVSDAALSTTNSAGAPQPHLGVRDLNQLKKSLGRYLTKNNTDAFSAASKQVAGVGLLSPFSHSGFLETPIEDFNSVANFDKKMQHELTEKFNDLVELNKQVESDKEIFLFKIISTNHKLDSLKNELDILNRKEIVAIESITTIKSELVFVLECEASAQAMSGSMHGGSIHNGQAIGLNSSHGRGSSHGGMNNTNSSHGKDHHHGSNHGSSNGGGSIHTSMHNSSHGNVGMLTAPYQETQIQTQGSIEHKGAKISRAADTAQLDQLGVLNIVSCRKKKITSKGSPDHSPRRKSIDDDRPNHHNNISPSSHRRRSSGRYVAQEYPHEPGQGQVSPGNPNQQLHVETSPGRPPTAPGMPVKVLSPLSSVAGICPGIADGSSQRRSPRRYVRGKNIPSPGAAGSNVGTLNKQSSFVNVDLSDSTDMGDITVSDIALLPHINKSNSVDTYIDATTTGTSCSTTSNKLNTDEKSPTDSTPVASASVYSTVVSYFSRKPRPSSAPPGGVNLLQAVKTGRRAAYIIEGDSTRSNGRTTPDSCSSSSSSSNSINGSTSAAPLAADDTNILTTVLAVAAESSVNVGDRGSCNTCSEATTNADGNTYKQAGIMSGTIRPDYNSDNTSEVDTAMKNFLFASTTAFIPDPSLHPDTGTIGNVLASWSGANKKMDSQFLKSELNTIEATLNSLWMKKSELLLDVEEETEKKDKMCEQLQLIMDDMYRKRSDILRGVIKTYVKVE